MALLWTMALVAAAAAHPAYEIPAFNVATLVEHKAPLVAALEEHGLVALKGLDGFAATRTTYLREAFRCMQAHPNMDLLQHKTLSDGTTRDTISTNAKDEELPMASLCPAYAAAHHAYVGLMQSATEALGVALDVPSSEHATSMRAIAESGKHLDHVHKYLAPAAPSSPETLSLELHTDNGLGLLTSAPLFFDRDGNQVQVETTGLEVELTLDGVVQRVAPRLKADELVLMIGEGFNRWGNFGHRFPPVVHGMKMPPSMDASVARVFSGRMLLMRADDRLVHAGLSFDEYAAATTRHLLEPSANFASLACPTGRSLLASDLSCTLGLWGPSNASDPSTTKAQCMRHCNSPNMRNEVEQCAHLKCVKTGDVPHGGTVCWMLCVEHLPDCAADAQTCLPDQTLVCPAAMAAAPTQRLWMLGLLGALGVVVLALAVRHWRHRRRHAQRCSSLAPTEASSLLA
ncbi:hypothetical protein SPRG_03418 [Saprolegnia parasitica CBS 223.65]|uniref:Uncharacterized protein n=1 Tax=Saprolegnia parasitica (strain CBS 223.65) TaxID=695850 RepID=A0A067D0D6_SAPPC|nr:hypothetical protein SPRG_03418 [Saprolegnia parasitica CBS 223.65]KDO32201.1 hypothetical protein SPRG_03418 [Saprolegnia parasitica CBS 223.65]|eukprot:XP_012197381.1 hypothetical protein SPRG_03418 [Saprolegnia parasitica CBS 223.65]